MGSLAASQPARKELFYFCLPWARRFQGWSSRNSEAPQGYKVVPCYSVWSSTRGGRGGGLHFFGLHLISDPGRVEFLFFLSPDYCQIGDFWSLGPGFLDSYPPEMSSRPRGWNWLVFDGVGGVGGFGVACYPHPPPVSSQAKSTIQLSWPLLRSIAQEHCTDGVWERLMRPPTVATRTRIKGGDAFALAHQSAALEDALAHGSSRISSSSSSAAAAAATQPAASLKDGSCIASRVKNELDCCLGSSHT